MKVILATIDYPPAIGGVANYYFNLAENWPEKDNFFVLNNNENKLINNKLPALKWLPAIFSLRREIKAREADHVLIGQILPLGTAMLINNFFKKTDYSIFLHGMDFCFAIKSKRKKWLAKKILSNAKNIFCVNSYVKKLAEEFLGTQKNIFLSPPGVNIFSENINQDNINSLKQKYNLENKKILFSIARLVERKGFDKTILAMTEVLNKRPDVFYVIAGDGPDRERLEKIKNSLAPEARENIILLSNISEENKLDWLSMADIFLMVARNINGDFEGFGIVYLEANAFGVPVIAGDSGGVRDAVRDGENGFLVDPENINLISEKIILLLSDNNLKNKISERAKAWAKKFSWDDTAKNIYDVLKK